MNAARVQKFDIGDILVTDELSIEPEETRPQLTQKMAQKGEEWVLKELRESLTNIYILM